MLKRAVVFLAGLSLALSVATVPSFADALAGTIVSVAADKVVLRLEKGRGAPFPVGTRDVEIRKGGVMAVRGRVMAVTGDEITLKVLRGKSGTLSAGVPVEVEQLTASEGVDGC